MERLQVIQTLNRMLLEELPQYREEAADFGTEIQPQRRLLRSLMNVRPPMPLREDYLLLEEALLSAEREERGVVKAETLPVVAADSRLVLWRGDITRLAASSIVNAANSALLGCFHPCHSCIDNAIHSAAGLQLREECRQLMEQQGTAEPAGRAKLTAAYHLPCRWVLHTVGPMVKEKVGARDRKLLASCYRACLELAAERRLNSIAFCCISTGEFHFPPQAAAEIAVAIVRDYLAVTGKEIKVIFNVFTEADEGIYRRLLGPNR